MGLQLPYDRLPIPGHVPQPERYGFDLPRSARGGAPSGLVPVLTTVFVVQLARATSQATIPLRYRHLARDGAHQARVFVARLPEALETSNRALLDEVARRIDQDAEDVVEELPAEITILDASSNRPRPSSMAALHLVVELEASRATFEYDANVFDRATIERFAGHFSALLQSFAANLDAAVGALPIFGPGEERLVRAAGEGRARRVASRPIIELFEAQAARRPEAIAIRFHDQKMAYGDLNARANRLAHHLIARGIGRESRVMVSLEPGFDIAIALLAILKAGAVYVPLEPTYPDARIRGILEDTAPALVLTQAKLVPKVSTSAAPVFAVDRDVLPSELPSTNPTVAITREQTAYVYYTSGTTGKPKGVMASQANLAHYIGVSQERYGFDEREVMPAIARFSFSISMFELLSPLVCGGTLLLLEREHVVDLVRMSQTLSEVTFFHAGPSLLRGVVAYIREHHAKTNFAAFARVRHASSGGDMVPPELLESLKEIFSRAEVFVIYGCSEIACMGCTFPAPRDQTIHKTYVGHAFDDVTVRILDEGRRVVPFGIVGEICFAGSGVVKGYLDRPELTREKFVEIDGQRFYCTGDMGRMNARGDVEILGRRDFQVQLRGMRIELGEIDYALRKAPGVRDAVAMARPDASGEKILVGYVVFSEAQTADSLPAVKKHMALHLPDYMVPSAYVVLPSLPLNHNMKVDRHALPAPQASDQRAFAAVVRAPETETEAALALLWKELLQLDEVGIDDNFFELGGHSILAVRLILEVERKLGIALEGIELLREPLEALARGIDRRLGRPEKPPSASSERRAAPVGEVDEPFYFGDDGALYGVFHPAAASAPATNHSAGRRALLVVAPLGQESARAHFVLRTIARKAALLGIPALRFDFFGTGNSLGDDVDGTCERWQSNIATAYAELERRAGTSAIAVLAVRSGALLAAHSRAPVNRSDLLLWDPVLRGADHVETMRRVQRTVVRGMDVRLGRMPRPRPGVEELLGFTYADSTLRGLAQLTLGENTSAHATTLRVAHDCQWNDPAALEDVLPDAGFSNAVVDWLKGSS